MNESRGAIQVNNDAHNPIADVNLAVQWASERCPIIDGIVFGKGRVKQIRAVWKKQYNDSIELVLEPGDWTTLMNLDQQQQLDWTGTIHLCATEDSSRGIQILGGEGGQGSDGFVANIQSGSGEIIWIAFFTTSNPFEVVNIQGDCVLAKTSLGVWWKFPLDAPEQVTIQ